jgi:hypothetical protein
LQEGRIIPGEHAIILSHKFFAEKKMNVVHIIGNPKRSGIYGDSEEMTSTHLFATKPQIQVIKILEGLKTRTTKLSEKQRRIIGEITRMNESDSTGKKVLDYISNIINTIINADDSHQELKKFLLGMNIPKSQKGHMSDASIRQFIEIAGTLLSSAGA